MIGGQYLLLLPFVMMVSAQAADTCSSIMASASDEESKARAFLCQLHESAEVVSQLSALLSDGLNNLLAEQGIIADLDVSNAIEKRKHEYLRFGKRKHEYLRFGKRKHEYLRFGKRKHEYLRFG